LLGPANNQTYNRTVKAGLRMTGLVNAAAHRLLECAIGGLVDQKHPSRRLVPRYQVHPFAGLVDEAQSPIVDYACAPIIHLGHPPRA
jgi:hypothetical protein